MLLVSRVQAEDNGLFPQLSCLLVGRELKGMNLLHGKLYQLNCRPLLPEYMLWQLQQNHVTQI